MNKVCLIGRLTSKPELKKTSTGVDLTRFTVAVNRNFNNQDGIREADFINCTAWRKTADIICKYLDKGKQIGIEGHIQTGNYEDKDGNKRQSCEIVIDELTFIGKMEENQKVENKDNNTIYTTEADEEDDPFKDFGNDIEDDELPF